MSHLKHLSLAIFAVVFVIVVLLTCGQRGELFSPTDAGSTCYAFVSNTAVSTLSSIADTVQFTTTDTIHTADSITLVGVIYPPSDKINRSYWTISDGTTGNQNIFRKKFASGGVYRAVFTVEDNAGLTMRDTVTVHVNTPPVVTLVQPINLVEVGTNTTPVFTWSAADPDSAAQQRYGIFIGSSNPLTAYDLKGSNITAQTYTLWNSGTVQARYYWKVFAFDGYDTTVSAVDSFRVVNYSITTGRCAGYARLQGVGHHSGIKVFFMIQGGGTTSYTLSTDDDGYYYGDALFPGTYTVTASDTLRNEFQSASRTATIVIRDSVFLDTLTLLDVQNPVIAVTYPAADNDTLKDLSTRAATFSGTLSDVGSKIRQDSVKITLNGIQISNPPVTLSSWSFPVADITDGHYTITVNAKDSAGNAATQVTRTFYVNSKTISSSVAVDTLSVNDSISLTVSLTNVHPKIHAFYFNYDAHLNTAWDDSVVTGDSSITRKWATSLATNDGKMIVRAVDDSGMAVWDSVAYVVLQDVPVPDAGSDTSVTINAPVVLRGTYTQQFGTIVMYKWDFDDNGIYDDSSATTDSAVHTYTHEAAYTARFSVRDDDGNEAADTRQVTVVNAAPVISSIRSDTTISIKDSIELYGTAADNDGTIVEYAWDFDGDGTFDYTSATQITAGYRYNNVGKYNAVLRVTDDDGKITKDTAVVTVNLDAPLVTPVHDTIVSQTMTVTINVTAVDTNAGGSIQKYYWDVGADGWDDSTSAPRHDFAYPAGGLVTIVWAAMDDDSLMVRDTFNILFNRPPSNPSLIAPTADTSWITFNWNTGKGTLPLTLSASDADLPYDTLTYALSLGPDPGSLIQVYSGRQTQYNAANIGSNTIIYWQLVVRDLYGDSASATGNLIAPLPLPHKWSALGSGMMNGTVLALAFDSSGNLYAGGGFTTAGGISARSIAKWNGSSWSALGSGMNGGNVWALAVDNSGNLYAGGNFTTAGGVSANRVAKWNGSSWSALGSGMNGSYVYGLAVDGSGNLYAGGDFTTAGGVPANYIAKWDGSSWTAVGGGTNQLVVALVCDGSGNLYAAGGFNTAGGVSANGVAKWDGSTWSALGSGMSGGPFDLAIDRSGNLYAADGVITITKKWDGSSWSALGSGMDSTSYSLAVDGSGNLYAGGSFTTAGGVSANRIAKWDGSVWSALGSGMNSRVEALAVDSSGNLYAGGQFTTAGGVSVNRIAKW
jgi:PKD repeat protein